MPEEAISSGTEIWEENPEDYGWFTYFQAEGITIFEKLSFDLLQWTVSGEHIW